ncbi:MAG: hypothetical protein AB7N65_10470, partial [Vicinamibacterales bacterium]
SSRWGGVRGSLRGVLTLTNSDAVNIFSTSFLPGRKLTFRLWYSVASEDDGEEVPSRLSVYLVDRDGVRVPTLSPAADALLELDISRSRSRPEAFGADTSRAPTVGEAIPLRAPRICEKHRGKQHWKKTSFGWQVKSAC